MEDLARLVADVVTTAGFSGALRVDREGHVEYVGAFGLADRAAEIANTVDTRFAIASGTKGLTALAVVRLIESGVLTLDTSARSVLGADLPLIDDRVTVEHLLGHTSGIGDYYDEESDRPLNEPLEVSPLDLATTAGYLSVLDGHPQKFAPGTRFSYSNGGYVVLALVAERSTGVDFAELVDTLVCQPAGMPDTAFLRSDALPAGAARGYLAPPPSLQTNVFVLPARGSGDGGIYTTIADVHALWDAFSAGKIVAPSWVAEMTRARHTVGRLSMRYGLGFWLHPDRSVVMLEGIDAGVSFRSSHDPARNVTATVVSNDSDGVWPLVRELAAFLFA